MSYVYSASIMWQTRMCCWKSVTEFFTFLSSYCLLYIAFLYFMWLPIWRIKLYIKTGHWRTWSIVPYRFMFYRKPVVSELLTRIRLLPFHIGPVLLQHCLLNWRTSESYNSHAHCKIGDISEMIQDRHVVTTDH